jgi:hypothetical protein
VQCNDALPPLASINRHTVIGLRRLRALADTECWAWRDRLQTLDIGAWPYVSSYGETPPRTACDVDM